MSSKLESLSDTRFTPLNAEEARETLGGLAASATPAGPTFVAYTFLGDGTWVADYVMDADPQPVVA